MEFSFEANPDLDVAIGAELLYEDSQEMDFLTDDLDLTGLDPMIPTGAKPGSEDKVRMLAARYAAGVPLWHDEDCYDHGPTEPLFDLDSSSESHYDLDPDL